MPHHDYILLNHISDSLPSLATSIQDSIVPRFRFSDVGCTQYDGISSTRICQMEPNKRILSVASRRLDLHFIHRNRLRPTHIPISPPTPLDRARYTHHAIQPFLGLVHKHQYIVTQQHPQLASTLRLAQYTLFDKFAWTEVPRRCRQIKPTLPDPQRATDLTQSLSSFSISDCLVHFFEDIFGRLERGEYGLPFGHITPRRRCRRYPRLNRSGW